jgi:hypothetical protein
VSPARQRTIRHIGAVHRLLCLAVWPNDLILEIISELNKEDPLAIVYRKYSEEFKKYILIRNKSILAHGIKPVSKDEYLKLENMSKVFIKSIISSSDEEVFKIDKCFDYKILEQ